MASTLPCMPRADFTSLPDDARVWVFAADRPLDPSGQHRLLDAVDGFLDSWNAHGAPLQCAREWRDGRFLAVGVDQRAAGASGCSIDGLFRVLQSLGPSLGASLLPTGKVFWRDGAGVVQCGERASFRAHAAAGEVTIATPVFDTTVTSAQAWRDAFEVVAEASWHRTLL
jgi:hypothetical protein